MTSLEKPAGQRSKMDNEFDFIDLSDQDDDLPIEEKFKREFKRRKTCVAGHLGAPIYAEEVTMLLEGDEKIFSCYRHKKIKKRIAGCSHFNEITDIYGTLDSWIKGKALDKKVVENRWRMVLGGSRNWIIQKLSFMFPARKLYELEDLKSDCSTVLSKVHSNMNLIFQDFENSMKSELIKDSVCFKEMELGDFINLEGDSFERDLSIIKLQGKKYLLPTNLVLCSLDKLQSIFWLKLYWLLVDAFDLYPGESIFQTGSRWLSMLYKIRSRGLDGFFSFMADLEPLIVGFTVALPDDLGCTDLFEDQKRSIDAFLQSTGLPYSHHDFLPTEISPNLWTDNSVLMHLELTGISKVMGYPILKAGKLLDQLREHGTTGSVSTDLNLITQLDGIMRRDICVNMLKKKGFYPKIRFYPGELVCLSTGKPPNAKEMKNYELWSRVRFSKNFNFNYSPDLSEITKDSSCAPNKSAYSIQYDRCAYMYLYGKGPPRLSPAVKRGHLRSIDAYIKATPGLVRKLITDRENGIYDPEDHIIVQCGKELELKEDSGRAFTKQTSNQRYVQVSLEQNIADSIFPFVPEQSMTDSEIVIINRHMSQVFALGGSSVVINIDLTKWCLRQRAINTSFGGKMYDELFGLKGIYEDSHNFFYYVTATCNSRFSPPDYDHAGNPIPGPFFLDNFLGGCEGMKQKAWTHITSAVLKLALEELNLRGSVMGQGDNQIVIIHMSRTDNPQQVTLEFIDYITALFSKINHKVKPRETWYSKNLHEYGKTRIWKGCAVPGGTKKSTKIVPDINDGLFSIHSSMSTINTITESIAKASWSPDIAFIINQSCQANYISRRILSNIKTTVEDVRSLLLFPSDFGGLPLSSYTTHAIRGCDDHVTSWMGVLNVCKLYFPTFYNKMLSIWELFPSTTPISALSRKRLFEDPYSLNIKTLPSADRQIKECTLAFLQSSEVTNPTIIKIYSKNFQSSYDNMITILDTMNPCYAQLGNNLLKISNPGIGKRLQGKLTASKTIERATIMFTSTSLIDLITEKNDELIIELKKRLRKNNRGTNAKWLNIDCPYTSAVLIREKSWNKKFIELTKPPHWHQVELMSYDQAIAEGLKSRSIVIQLSDDVVQNPMNFRRKFGPFKPYVGSHTKEKIKKPSIDILDKTTYTTAFLEAGKTRSWIQMIGAPNLEKFTTNLINEKLDLISMEDTGDEILAFPEVLSGNMFHRLSTSIEHSNAMVNGLLTQNSHYFQSSNNLQSMTSDGEDFSIFFQGIYAHNISILSMIAGSGRKLPPQVAAVLRCTTCTHQLPEPKFDIAPFRPWVARELMESKKSIIIPYTPDILTPGFMELLIGQKLAEVVDINYIQNHSTSDDCDSYLNRGSSVSINDLKRCDLKQILFFTFVFSKHCRNILASRQRSLLLYSTDLSFYHLAELISNASLRSVLTSLFNVYSQYHTSMCTIEGLSSYIGKYFPTFLENLSHDFLNSACKLSFKDDLGTYKAKYYLKNVVNLLPFSVDRAKFNDAYSKGNIKRLKDLMGFDHVVCNIKKDLITQSWRSNPTPKPTIVYARHQLNSGTCQFPYSLYVRFFNSDPVYKSNAYNKAHYSARPFYAMSSGCCKYIEVLLLMRKMESVRTTKLSFHCLADGSGGCLTAFLILNNDCKGVYNTLISPTIDHRDVVTDWFPPALVASGISLDRLADTGLSSGITNLMDPGINPKIENAIRDQPPFLVTMDAEDSIQSSNLNIIEKIAPLYLQQGCPILIFKVFLHDLAIADKLTELSSTFPDYFSFLYKPVSTPPFSREYLWVSTRLPLTADERDQLSAISNIGPSDLSGNNIVHYLSLCDKISSSILTYLPSGNFIKSPTVGSESCSLFCCNHVRSIIDAIDEVHSSSGEDIYKISIKKSGYNGLLKKLIYELYSALIFLTIPEQTLRSWFLTASNFKLLEENIKTFRDNVSRGESPCPILEVKNMVNISNTSIIEQWSHAKFMIRDITVVKDCRCFFEAKPRNKHPSLSRSLVDAYPLQKQKFLSKFFPVKYKYDYQDDNNTH